MKATSLTKENKKLLEDVAAHLKKHDGFHMDDTVDYPGYPDQREAEAQRLYRRIKEALS
jgi:hypothetical protein